MLIVNTKDANIITAAQQVNTWGNVNVIPNANTQNQADTTLGNFITALGQQEDLCFTSHGNNDEMGDAGNGANDWGWTCNAIATLLKNNLPANYSGRILFRLCCTNVANYSAGAAAKIGQGGGARNNIWCYGYNTSVPINAAYITPQQISTNVSLQGTMS